MERQKQIEIQMNGIQDKPEDEQHPKSERLADETEQVKPKVHK